MGWTVAIGVDTHMRFHVAVALDRFGGQQGVLELEASEHGYAQLLAFASALGKPVFVVEGTGSYGAGLTRYLLVAGQTVFECERPQRRGRAAKNDRLDAERAARRLVAGERLATPRAHTHERELLRLLLAERRSCQQSRLQARSQLQAALLTAPAQLHTSAVITRLRTRIEQLQAELAAIDRELAQLTQALCPTLLAEHSVGPLCAAQLLVSSGDPRRLRSEAAFAALAGVSPIEASSGIVKRHRLNRGGDRQHNGALHMSALNRIRFHAETRAYYQRQLARGKSKREAIRIVKRVLARRLYHLLTSTLEAHAAT
jgi:transposase